MARVLRYLTAAAIVVALVCVQRSFRLHSLGWGIAAGSAFVAAVVMGGVSLLVTRPGNAERTTARTTFVVAAVVLGAALLYFLIGLHNLSG